MSDRFLNMNRREFVAATTGTVLAATSGCTQLQEQVGSGTATPDGWTTFRGDHRRTGYRPDVDGPGQSLSLDWEVTAMDLIEEIEGDDPMDGLAPLPRDVSSPVLADDVVVWTTVYDWGASGERTTRYRVVAVDPESGTLLWSQSLFDPDETLPDAWFGPVVADGELYVPTTFDDEIGVTIFDPSTGDSVRELDLGLSLWTTELAVTDSRIFVADADQEALYAFDTDNGELLWDAEAATHPGMQFTAVADDLLYYFDHGDRALVARAADDGDERFRVTPDLPDLFVEDRPTLLSPPVVTGGRLYAAGDAHVMFVRDFASLVAADATDGGERFQYEPPRIEGEENPLGHLHADADAPPGQLPPFSAVYGLPVVLDDLVVATGYGDFGGADEPDGHCFAVDTEEGELAWALDSGIAYAPVATSEGIYLVSNEGVEAVSHDGDSLDTFAPQEETDASERIRMSPRLDLSPAIDENRLLVPTYGGIVALS